MRGNRDSVDTKLRETNQDQRFAKYILCAFYEGLLPTGVKSPGYLETTTGDRRPAAYVVPIAELREAGTQRLVDPMPVSDNGAVIKWAREYVRLIKLKSNLGLSSQEILDDYYVRVPYPFSSASTGELIRKPGRAESQASVPDGVTLDDVIKNKMLDKSIPLSDRANMAQARYGKMGSPVRGVPIPTGREQFPGDHDLWIGSQ